MNKILLISLFVTGIVVTLVFFGAPDEEKIALMNELDEIRQEAKVGDVNDKIYEFRKKLNNRYTLRALGTSEEELRELQYQGFMAAADALLRSADDNKINDE